MFQQVMHNSYVFYTLDVFTDQLFGGNPLAVFPEAEGLTTQQMQAIAQELNLSETVFVLPPKQADCDFKLRIFTPCAELPFAGHPTVGTAYLLAHLEKIKIASTADVVNLEEGVGTVPVKLQWHNQLIQTTALQAAQLPIFSEAPKLNFADLLSLASTDLDVNLPAEIISCGLPFLYVPLQSKKAVDCCTLNMNLWQAELAESEAQNVYVFARGGQHIYARMFAPGLGIAEDPATGSAATSLAGYLHKHCDSVTAHQTWQIIQGVKMGRPSELQLTYDLDEQQQILAIAVGGSSVLVSQGTMRVN